MWLQSNTRELQWLQYLNSVFLEIANVTSWSVFQNQVTFVNIMILHSEEIFTIFKYYIQNRRYIIRYMEPIMRANFSFTNPFEITKFAKLQDL